MCPFLITLVSQIATGDTTREATNRVVGRMCKQRLKRMKLFISAAGSYDGFLNVQIILVLILQVSVRALAMSQKNSFYVPLTATHRLSVQF